MDTPLLVLYGSQTGNAQDVAERIGREARLRLFKPRVVAMDSYDVTSLPSEQLLVCVTSTTGQGDPPDNMRRFWRFLLRRSLPPDSLAACSFAVFGLGDSGYPNYNVVAKKLDKRLAGLGARVLLERGLGDDQHPNGYEAALDPWLARLWPALRALAPLPEGVQQPLLTEESLLALSPPKLRLTPLRSPAQTACAARQLAARLRREQPHLPVLGELLVQQAQQGLQEEGLKRQQGLQEQVEATHGSAEGQILAEEEESKQQQAEAAGGGCGSGGEGGGDGSSNNSSSKGCGGSSSSSSSTGLEATLRLAEAVAAAADFRRLLQYVSGVPVSVSEPEPKQDPRDVPTGGGHRPTTAVLQDGEGADVRHPPLPYTYGPWRPYLARLAVNRRITAPEHFQDTRHIELDLDGSGLSYEPGDLVAILPMTATVAVDAFLQRLGLDGEAWVRLEAAEEQQQQRPQQSPDDDAVTHGSCGAGEAAPCVVARVRSLVQGCLDIAGASPRRFLFQVLHNYAATELERERLAHFASAEGRDDLYRYNQRESRTLSEVLSDFPSASPPLERLLESAPLLRPRLFSAASSQSLRGPSAVHLLVALVSYNTPLRRRRVGLCSGYLGGLDPAAAEAAGEEIRVAVWTERGSLRPPKSPNTPLILIGPGTGVAPFRAFLEDRYATILASNKDQQQQQQQQAPNDQEQQQQQPSLQQPLTPPPAPCFLFFGCRSRSADFYYSQQWKEYMRAGVLHPTHGLITAFSREAAAAPPQQGQTQQQQQQQQPVADGSNGAVAAAGGEAPAAAGRNGSTAVSSSGSKVYVTQRIREQGELLWGLLSEGGAAVYVSGAAKKMPAGVAAAFADVAVQYGGLGTEAAAAFVRQLELKGRYQVEAWS
ncbi:hypothetical protein Agub_g9842 [Astrephomene gubernaculifera]|uniref:NADPH-dependent diflavin oxidoreductase 1 n=1 Tax=Astrephomene gubernaculifera TaxID=47775 RepID=A0AAD3DUC4_9CHLO|nr:hypothetical protein Agub_g9842 [Astrephomene gubernaculifera]